MSVLVKSPGLLTTIQDMGRSGYGEYGVPISGPMDGYSAKMANLLVGNTAEEALMEMNLQGPELQFEARALVALTGVDAQIMLDGRPKTLNAAFVVEAGGKLSVTTMSKGVWAYLAIKGGFRTETILGSRSFYGGLTKTKRLAKGDRLPFSAYKEETNAILASLKFDSERYISDKLTVFKGPEWGELSDKTREKLLGIAFTVSKTMSRQAYQLSEKIANNMKPILSQPVLPGTVQLTPGGNSFILMRDAQTTGGYPRILQLDGPSINNLAQKRPGNKIRFELRE